MVKKELKTRPPSMIDVAKHAGVSHQTVSRVVNNDRNVTEKTRSKVLNSIEALGYRPNSAARALVTGVTSSIGIIGYNTKLYGPASTMHALQSKARDMGYDAHVISLETLTQDSIIDAINEHSLSGVKGVIINVPYIQEFSISEINGINIPKVFVEGPTENNLHSVNIDQVLGSQRAVQFLIENGHKKIAHISGPRNWFETEQRVMGWESTLAKNELQASVLFEGDWSPQSGYNAACEIIKEGSSTAIFCANDQMAFGVYKAAYESKLEIGRDISIVGFDGLPESEFFIPGLTTISQDFDEMGRASLNMLHNMFSKNMIQKNNILIKPKLVVRESVGSPR
jgi:DNA-binding LacI/PurR family transcriptional regulator